MSCATCGREMNVPGDPASRDCGGDCAACVEAMGDPDVAIHVVCPCGFDLAVCGQKQETGGCHNDD